MLIDLQQQSHLQDPQEPFKLHTERHRPWQKQATNYTGMRTTAIPVDKAINERQVYGSRAEDAASLHS